MSFYNPCFLAELGREQHRPHYFEAQNQGFEGDSGEGEESGGEREKGGREKGKKGRRRGFQQRKAQIFRLIPHRGPFITEDEVTQLGRSGTRTPKFVSFTPAPQKNHKEEVRCIKASFFLISYRMAYQGYYRKGGGG